MERLTTLDAGFLEAEDSDHHVSLAVGGLSILEGPMPDFDELSVAMAEKVMAIPRFRQVLHTHLLDLEAPEWVDDPNFDLAHHIIGGVETGSPRQAHDYRKLALIVVGNQFLAHAREE